MAGNKIPDQFPVPDVLAAILDASLLSFGALVGVRDITRFFPRIDRIFPGEALNPFFGAQDEGFSEFCSR